MSHQVMYNTELTTTVFTCSKCDRGCHVRVGLVSHQVMHNRVDHHGTNHCLARITSNVKLFRIIQTWVRFLTTPQLGIKKYVYRKKNRSIAKLFWKTQLQYCLLQSDICECGFRMVLVCGCSISGRKQCDMSVTQLRQSLNHDPHTLYKTGLKRQMSM